MKFVRRKKLLAINKLWDINRVKPIIITPISATLISWSVFDVSKGIGSLGSNLACDERVVACGSRAGISHVSTEIC